MLGALTESNEEEAESAVLAQLYSERSTIRHIHGLVTPVWLLQRADD